MPVKNKNRQTNSGYEGVITGLNDKEKKVLEDAGIGGGGQVFFDLFAYYDEANDKITQEGWNKLSNGLINGTYCGILYDEIPLVLCGFNGSRTLYSFTNTEEKDNVSIKIIVKSDLTYTIENVPVLNIPALPSDASTKNCALNSVNGTLTWNTIGNGLEIKDGALQATSSGFNIFDNAFSIGVAENINEETFTLTGVGLNKINSMFTNGKLLGLCLEDPANITTDFTFVPFISLTSDNYCFGATTYIAGTNVQFTLIKINKTTGAVEMIQKLMAATDAQ